MHPPSPYGWRLWRRERWDFHQKLVIICECALTKRRKLYWENALHSVATVAIAWLHYSAIICIGCGQRNVSRSISAYCRTRQSTAWHLHYQLSKTCSRHIFSHVLTSLTNCFQWTLYGALVVTLAILLRLINCRFIIIIIIIIIIVENLTQSKTVGFFMQGKTKRSATHQSAATSMVCVCFSFTIVQCFMLNCFFCSNGTRWSCLIARGTSNSDTRVFFCSRWTVTLFSCTWLY